MLVLYFPFTGTDEYNPPEASLKNSETTYDPESVAIWSIGVLTYAVVTGDYPYHTLIQLERQKLYFPPGLSRSKCTMSIQTVFLKKKKKFSCGLCPWFLNIRFKNCQLIRLLDNYFTFKSVLRWFGTVVTSHTASNRQACTPVMSMLQKAVQNTHCTSCNS